ncbi:peptidoglycan editing factor PgeF [Paenibacillus albiflavus]|uniref:Purine nucleoside phosphorylase n=1 Tax=Paenibacillus albiflavus TaxID=2545760 RepID=A0A4R4E017_9BACL|nr:peptidoglycan editing factor PgeF [Paenibacillus albiflavus]TCZ72301.1 peptidoglycan editing factor PgeF [Paenibacillus albiflavus]
MRQAEPFVRTEQSNHIALFQLQAWIQQFPFLTAGMTSRHGGISKAPYDSLNLGLHVGDAAEDVVANRSALAAAIGLPFEACTFAEQVHGNEVSMVSSVERGKGRTDKDDSIRNVDALITAEPDTCLCLMYADCVPLYFIDPIRQVIAVSHAGWKGTAQNIVGTTINKMVEHYGCDPSDIKAAIGPSIGECCYEVNQEVVDKMAVHISPVVRPSRNPDKYMMNLQEINRLFMIKAGILSSNIEISKLCTSCHKDDFYSYRAEGGTTGRMIAWLAIRG